MSQKTKGIYSILSKPQFYSIFQMIMSGTSFRRMIVKNFIKKKNVNILDIGCGPAEILDSLPQVNYFGYDINSEYIDYAKNKYKDRGNFYYKKFTEKELKKLPKFDYILLFGILHHLEDKEVYNLLKLAKKVLKKIGRILTEDPILMTKQNILSKFIIKMDRGANVRSKKEYIFLIKKFFKKINSKIYHQKFIPYTWFVMNCKK
mgnify:CR=1 FL=1